MSHDMTWIMTSSVKYLCDADKDVGGSILKIAIELNPVWYPCWGLPAGGGTGGSFGLLSTVLISGSLVETPWLAQVHQELQGCSTLIPIPIQLPQWLIFAEMQLRTSFLVVQHGQLTFSLYICNTLIPVEYFDYYISPQFELMKQKCSHLGQRRGTMTPLGSRQSTRTICWGTLLLRHIMSRRITYLRHKVVPP